MIILHSKKKRKKKSNKNNLEYVITNYEKPNEFLSKRTTYKSTTYIII